MTRGTVHFVRHAQTLFNVNGQLQGWCDSPLTARGERQIAALGERMRGVPLVAAFMSDLTRTRTTAAAALAGHPSIEPVPTTALREWHFGGFEGQPNASLWEPVFADHGYSYVPASADWPRMTDAGLDTVIDAIHRHDPSGRADTAVSVRQRVEAALALILPAAEHGDVLVVTHGTVLGSLLRAIDPAHRPRAGFPNCGIVPVTDGVIGPIDASCAVE
ncbi:histidine phosphatase family protein [Rathayibacter sp. VKM Ac-2856]|uniref:histidine phosphatase family protein n=1 Tax=unclassified Rathayibacter TaxID=2609250 RepID=UPI0015672216|nr:MULTISPECIES: histidine phosphatase family protein [unclassified Rathayibacter]NQX04823.1 histidine phosphatase family protein [Rathayibacter sp. VKM Ac-2858]NQX19991.1 histidine phosphatase family protein [Rathayibacter sp. VKM Ac-2856]